MPNNKRAQVGETMTWIVATIIIIVMLGISIYIADAQFEKKKLIDAKSVKTNDVLASKSLFAYVLTEENGKTIYEQLKDEENLNDFNGNLGTKIFKDIYGKEYLNVWLGIKFNRTTFPWLPNEYLGERPSVLFTLPGGQTYSSKEMSQQIVLDVNKSIELNLYDSDYATKRT